MKTQQRQESSASHVIIGAGHIGMQLAKHLASQGTSVRLVRRRAPGAAIPGVTWMQGDITDADFARRACQGASVLYHCANPAAYHKWGEFLLPLGRAVRDAAAISGARLVVLDNLYMYGRPDGPMHEDSSIAPCSKKGELRAQLVEELFDDHKSGRIQATSGRASDFFGPENPMAAIFHERFYQRLLSGKSVEVMGDPDQLHSYSYTPDVARGLAILGQRPEAVGKVWHLPVAAQGTTRELIEAFASAAGTSTKIRRIPDWLLRSLGVVSPFMAAVGEMTYQWHAPFVLDDGLFTETFGQAATGLDEAIATCLAYYGGELAAAA
jgi:nucleoside-diphosphate-sugar epimerase